MIMHDERGVKYQESRQDYKLLHGNFNGGEGRTRSSRRLGALKG